MSELDPIPTYRGDKIQYIHEKTLIICYIHNDAYYTLLMTKFYSKGTNLHICSLLLFMVFILLSDPRSPTLHAVVLYRQLPDVCVSGTVFSFMTDFFMWTTW